MSTMQQENFKVAMVGEIAIPDLAYIVGMLAGAAATKTSITLTAGEARILMDKILEE